MTTHVQNVQRIRAYTEPNGSFAVDNTGTLASFTDIPAVEGTIDVTNEQPTIDPLVVRQNMYDHGLEVLGPKRGRVAFDINLGPATTMSTSAASAALTPVGLLLKTYCGHETIGRGDVVDGKTDADTFSVVTSGRFSGGGALGWVNANSTLELHEIKAESTWTIQTKTNLLATAATGDIIYGCRSYALGNHDSSSVESMQFLVEGLGDATGGYEDAWAYFGAQNEAPVKITLANGEIPKLSFEYVAANWLNGDDAAMTPAALATGSYTNVEEVLIVDSALRVSSAFSPAYTEYCPSAMAFEFGQKYAPVTCPGGTNNIKQWMPMPDHPAVKGTLTLPYEDQTWFDYKAARTVLHFFLQIGSTVAGGGILLTAAHVQITDVKRVDAGGIASQQITWVSRKDNYATATTDLATSPFKIHIF